jgi:hypothetical protein
MFFRKSKTRVRRAARPSVEGMEGRQLLSTLPVPPASYTIQDQGAFTPPTGDGRVFWFGFYQPSDTVTGVAIQSHLNGPNGPYGYTDVEVEYPSNYVPAMLPPNGGPDMVEFLPGDLRWTNATLYFANAVSGNGIEFTLNNVPSTDFIRDVNNIGDSLTVAAVGNATINGVGHGILFYNGVTYDLNSFIPRSSGYTIVDAFNIDDQGNIIAEATDAQGSDRQILLTPSSLPIPTYTPPTYTSTFTDGTATGYIVQPTGTPWTYTGLAGVTDGTAWPFFLPGRPPATPWPLSSHATPAPQVGFIQGTSSQYGTSEISQRGRGNLGNSDARLLLGEAT